MAKKKNYQPTARAPEAKAEALLDASACAPDAKGSAMGVAGIAGEGEDSTASPSPASPQGEEKVTGGAVALGNAKAEVKAQAGAPAKCNPGLSEEIPGKYRKFQK